MEHPTASSSGSAGSTVGQQHVCHLWNLVAEDTREGQVYLRVLGKLEEQRRALGGQVWDVLGSALPGRALRSC